jgi:hypothetical protein
MCDEAGKYLAYRSSGASPEGLRRMLAREVLPARGVALSLQQRGFQDPGLAAWNSPPASGGRIREGRNWA